MTMSFSISYSDEALRFKAEQLATRLNLEVNTNKTSCLYLDQDKLQLKIEGFNPMSVDFQWDTWKKRRSEGKSQGIVRACKPGKGLTIIDATAGWGRDSAILAAFGADVTMLERNPIMAELIQDGLHRMSSMDKEHLHLSLVFAEAVSYLENLDPAHYPDVIYIDPMHPARSKSALVKKEMQALQQMIGPDLDAKELIACALRRVKQRVVVKWPQKVPALLRPSMSVSGKTVRYDVYTGI